MIYIYAAFAAGAVGWSVYSLFFTKEGFWPDDDAGDYPFHNIVKYKYVLFVVGCIVFGFATFVVVGTLWAIIDWVASILS